MSKKNDDYAVKLQEYINKEKMTTLRILKS